MLGKSAWEAGTRQLGVGDGSTYKVISSKLLSFLAGILQTTQYDMLDHIYMIMPILLNSTLR